MPENCKIPFGCRYAWGHYGCSVPPVAVLIKKAIKIEKGSGKPNKEKVAKITKEQVKAIAEQKMPDLNAASLEAAMSMVAGTARAMGVVVVD